MPRSSRRRRCRGTKPGGNSISTTGPGDASRTASKSNRPSARTASTAEPPQVTSLRNALSRAFGRCPTSTLLREHGNRRQRRAAVCPHPRPHGDRVRAIAERRLTASHHRPGQAQESESHVGKVNRGLPRPGTPRHAPSLPAGLPPRQHSQNAGRSNRRRPHVFGPVSQVLPSPASASGKACCPSGLGEARRRRAQEATCSGERDIP